MCNTLREEDNLSQGKEEKPELDLGNIRKPWFSVAENSCWQIVDIKIEKEASDILWFILNLIEIEVTEDKL